MFKSRSLRPSKWFLAAIVTWMLICITAAGGVIYVAAHFAAKYW